MQTKKLEKILCLKYFSSYGCQTWFSWLFQTLLFVRQALLSGGTDWGWRLLQTPNWGPPETPRSKRTPRRRRPQSPLGEWCHVLGQCPLNHCSRFYYKYPGWYNPLNRFTKRSTGTDIDSGVYWMNDDFSKKRNKISVPWSMQLFSPMLRGKWFYVCFYIVKKIEHKERLDLIYKMCIVHQKWDNRVLWISSVI